jgi:two-component system NtrC family sensor kinase
MVFCFLLNLILFIGPKDSLITVTSSMMDRDLISLGSLEDWKFQGGDNLEWANPSYDDSDWTRFSPSGLSEPIPDSLWNNYGWFRLSFKADSSIYEQPWNLYFYTWGAAEVYLDGKLVHTYGKFSSTPEEEKTFMPISKLHRPIQILPQEEHLLAIRFSYNRGFLYKNFIKTYGSNFGFGVGFSNKNFNDIISNEKSGFLRVFFISTSILTIILILQLFLIYLLPSDRSIHIVSLLIFIQLIHIIVGSVQYFFELNIVQNIIFYYLFYLLAVTIFSLYPLAITKLFNQKTDRINKIIIFLIPIITLTLLTKREINVLGLIIFNLFILILVSRILIKAHRSKQEGIRIIMFGFIGSLLGFLFSVLPNFLPFIPFSVQTIFITLVYIAIPLSMSLLIGYRFFLLNINLENQVVERTAELNQSLENLKSTQAQLIQSEKMASLGELTAGIAHEIQNPLNFVNNFSEVSEELIDELQEEIENGEFDEVKLIASDLKENLSKINHHGKRAGAIVKGMLEHSRSNSREKSETDINALAEEYLKLSYHGLRAKDKSFEAYFKTDLDPDLPKIKVVTQDLGRVFLNLINNAFYAVNEKAKLGSNGYQPEVIVSSKKNENGVEISVKDNGNGIPDANKEKIFQPFFTTKPTGSGTGLGLSLSYDIIKAHGGELRVISEEGKGTEMKITLPIHKDS